MSKIVTMAPFNIYPAPKGVQLRNVYDCFETIRLSDSIMIDGKRVNLLKKEEEFVQPTQTPLPASPTHEDRVKDAFAIFYEIDNECGSKSIAYAVIERAHGREIAELVAAET
jgi:hypothetical protein